VFAPLGGNRRCHHRRSRGCHQLWPDQNRIAVAVRPAGQIQPADEDRGATRRFGRLCRPYCAASVTRGVKSLFVRAAVLDGLGEGWSTCAMVVLHELRRRVRFVLGPIFGLALTGYFTYHLFEGDRGLLAWLRLSREIRTESANLQAVRAQREALDLR